MYSKYKQESINARENKIIKKIKESVFISLIFFWVHNRETHSLSNCRNVFSSSSRLLFNDVREPLLFMLRRLFNEFPGERRGVW